MSKRLTGKMRITKTIEVTEAMAAALAEEVRAGDIDALSREAILNVFEDLIDSYTDKLNRKGQGALAKQREQALAEEVELAAQRHKELQDRLQALQKGAA